MRHLLLALCLAACSSPIYFECPPAVAEYCNEAAGGRCLETRDNAHYCGYPSLTCPSGFYWSRESPMAATCVPVASVLADAGVDAYVPPPVDAAPGTPDARPAPDATPVCTVDDDPCPTCTWVICQQSGPPNVPCSACDMRDEPGHIFHLHGGCCEFKGCNNAGAGGWSYCR